MLYKTLKKKHWVKDKIKGKIKQYLDTNKNGNTRNQTMGCSKSSSKREVNSKKNAYIKKK